MGAGGRGGGVVCPLKIWWIDETEKKGDRSVELFPHQHTWQNSAPLQHNYRINIPFWPLPTLVQFRPVHKQWRIEIILMTCRSNCWWLEIAVFVTLLFCCGNHFPVGVGKTCLLLRYANDSFSPTFITTIGIDFKIKNIQLDGKRIKLQVGF